jgi:hypothetical protein
VSFAVHVMAAYPIAGVSCRDGASNMYTNQSYPVCWAIFNDRNTPRTITSCGHAGTCGQGTCNMGYYGIADRENSDRDSHVLWCHVNRCNREFTTWTYKERLSWLVDKRTKYRSSREAEREFKKDIKANVDAMRGIIIYDGTKWRCCGRLAEHANDLCLSLRLYFLEAVFTCVCLLAYICNWVGSRVRA